MKTINVYVIAAIVVTAAALTGVAVAPAGHTCWTCLTDYGEDSHQWCASPNAREKSRCETRIRGTCEKYKIVVLRAADCLYGDPYRSCASCITVSKGSHVWCVLGVSIGEGGYCAPPTSCRSTGFPVTDATKCLDAREECVKCFEGGESGTKQWCQMGGTTQAYRGICKSHGGCPSSHVGLKFKAECSWLANPFDTCKSCHTFFGATHVWCLDGKENDRGSCVPNCPSPRIAMESASDCSWFSNPKGTCRSCLSLFGATHLWCLGNTEADGGTCTPLRQCRSTQIALKSLDDCERNPHKDESDCLALASGTHLWCQTNKLTPHYAKGFCFYCEAADHWKKTPCACINRSFIWLYHPAVTP